MRFLASCVLFMAQLCLVHSLLDSHSDVLSHQQALLKSMDDPSNVLNDTQDPRNSTASIVLSVAVLSESEFSAFLDKSMVFLQTLFSEGKREAEGVSHAQAGMTNLYNSVHEAIVHASNQSVHEHEGHREHDGHRDHDSHRDHDKLPSEHHTTPPPTMISDSNFAPDFAHPTPIPMHHTDNKSNHKRHRSQHSSDTGTHRARRDLHEETLAYTMPTSNM